MIFQKLLNRITQHLNAIKVINKDQKKNNQEKNQTKNKNKTTKSHVTTQFKEILFFKVLGGGFFSLFFRELERSYRVLSLTTTYLAEQNGPRLKRR